MSITPGTSCIYSKRAEQELLIPVSTSAGELEISALHGRLLVSRVLSYNHGLYYESTSIVGVDLRS